MDKQKDLQDFLWQDGETIICLGDSITEASGGFVELMRLLSAAYYPDRRLKFVNAGIGGHKVLDLLARLDRDVILRRPDWVIISIGINDVWHDYLPDEVGVGFPEFKARYAEMIKKLTKQSQARIVLLTTTVIGEDLENEANSRLAEYNRFIREIAHSSGLLLVDVNKAYHRAIQKGRKADPGYRLTVDGVHPNLAGHLLIATAVLQKLGFNLEIP